MSISFRLRPTTLFVAGALLVPCAAFAQDLAPSIVPADSTTAPVPAPVASPVTVPTDTQAVLDMSFDNVEVTRLLGMLSTQFNMPIAIAGDVSGRLNSINLQGKTPEQALNVIVTAAQLSLQKTEDGTYIISKAPSASMVPAPVIGPASNLPMLNQPGNNGFGPTTNSNGVLQQFGLGGGGSANPATNNFETASEDEPTLVQTGNGTDSKERTFQVPIRNIKASMMAYWLDPANQPEPVDMRLAREMEYNYNNRPLVTEQLGGPQNFSGQFSARGNVNQPFNTQGVTPDPFTSNPYLNSNAEMLESQTFSNAQFGNNNGGGRNGNNNGGGRNGGNNNGRGGRNGGGNNGVFQLPDGVTRIVAVDPQNALLVFGTPEGAAKLANTIRFLDRPLRQVEIEAQFLSVSISDAKTYGFDFTTSRGNFNASSTGTASSVASGGLQVGFFRGNFQAAIQASITSGKAKILTAPRVTAINNLTANLVQSTSTPIVLTTTNTVANNGIAQSTGQQVFYVTTSIGLEVTPTINNDDTVTVLMQPFLQSQGTPNSLGASTVTSQQLQTIANVRDGETIALGGLRTTNITIDKTRVPLISNIPLIGNLFRSRNNRSTEAELIIFLTARIIHRVGDDDSVGNAADLNVGVGG